MTEDIKIRWQWLKVMYWYTVIGAGGFGLGIIVLPDTMQSVFGWPEQDPIFYGVTGSVWLAFALVSILGLRSPLKFIPILLLQLCYKIVWFIGVVFPLLVSGDLATSALLVVVIMASFIIGDLIAIPFSYVLNKSDVSEGVFAPTA